MAYSNPEANEVYGKEEAQAKILVNLLNTSDPQTLSEIYEGEIPILNGLGLLADILDSDYIRDSITRFLKYRVSVNRKGRQELVTISLASRYEGASGGSGGLKSILAGLK